MHQTLAGDPEGQVTASARTGSRSTRLRGGSSWGAKSVEIVMDAVSGRVVATLPIGKGNDAVAYDFMRRRVFSSNGVNGTITAYQQRSPDRYTALETIPTAVSGGTMALDPSSGRLFVAAADTDPAPVAGGRPRPRPGALKLLMFDPVR